MAVSLRSVQTWSMALGNSALCIAAACCLACALPIICIPCNGTLLLKRKSTLATLQSFFYLCLLLWCTASKDAKRSHDDLSGASSCATGSGITQRHFSIASQDQKSYIGLMQNALRQSPFDQQSGKICTWSPLHDLDARLQGRIARDYATRSNACELG